MSDEEKELETRCKAAARELHEFADSVVIIVTHRSRDDADGEPQTACYKYGRGNYFAQLGSVKFWLDDQADSSIPPDSRSEDWKGGQ